MRTTLCGPAGCHVSKMHEAGTNWGDVWIARIICGTIVLVALICAGAFLWWKHMEHKAHREAEERKRRWDVEDANRKKLNTLTDKRIEALKSQTEIKDGKGKVIGQKDFDSKEFTAYNEALKECIEKERTSIDNEKRS